MSTLNNHIENFLEYYYQFPSPPEYAVLLKGAWGSGKTFFIKKSLEKLESDDGKYIYVSLYGLTNYKEIEDAFFKQLHPVLSSKLMKLGGKVAKGLLKTTVKVDLDGDDKADASVSSIVPDIDLSDYFNNKKGFVLVFDDLERCSININDVLGYINHFVEHQGFKVIIIANEKIILERQDSEQTKLAYKDIKEKLIGETFEVKADLDGALDEFISNIASKEVQTFYSDQKKLISSLYLESSYDNLRHLKQALWGFERFHEVLCEKVKSNSKLVIDLLKLYLVYSFEIKSGNLLAGNLKPELVLEAESKEKTPFKIIDKKYVDLPIFTFRSPILEVETWEDIYGKGILDNEAINSYLLESSYFHDENTPDWLNLWNYWDITDDEFNESFKRVEKSFEDKEYEEIGEIKHVVAQFLQFSKIGIYNKSKEKILDEAKEYVNWLRVNNKLPDIHIDRYRWNNSYKGYGFLGEDSEEFKGYCQYVDEQIDQARIENRPEIGKDLLKLMTSDVNAFAGNLIQMGHECTYYDIPILSSIDPESFVDTFISLSPFEQNLVSRVFEKRYSFKNNCEDEKDWLIKISELMFEKQGLLEGQLSGFRIGRYIVTLNKSIKEIEVRNTGK